MKFDPTEACVITSGLVFDPLVPTSNTLITLQCILVLKLDGMYHLVSWPVLDV